MIDRSSMHHHTRDMPSRVKRPRDPDQLAQFIASLATGDMDDLQTEDGKNPAAVALGRMGGIVGGKARAAALSKTERVRIARAAALKRWGKSSNGK